MKVKRIKVGTSRPGRSLKKAKGAARRLKAGQKRGKELYFSSLAMLRKALSPRRVELLWAILEHEPHSMRDLAERVGRDIKNVSQDLAFLARLRMVEMKKAPRGIPQAPILPYDEIDLRLKLRP